MRQPYTHEYERFVDKFKNTSCYTQLTSRILSAARGGEYYGPTDGVRGAPWQYQVRDKCKCRNKQLCDAIHRDLYVATTKSSCLIEDRATEWYRQQKQMTQLKRTLSSMSPRQLQEFQCRYYDNFQFQSPPSNCLELKVPIRSASCLTSSYRLPSSVKRISPEFLELLRQHDARQRQRNGLYCLPEDYTKKKVRAEKKEKENIPPCKDARPCQCGSTPGMDAGKQKTDTHMDRHKIHKCFLKRWCFSAQDQTYPAEDGAYHCHQGRGRSLMHYARSQPRILVHEQCPPEAWQPQTCPFKCQEEEPTNQKSSTKIEKPRVHTLAGEGEMQFGKSTGTSRESEPDLRPRLHSQRSLGSLQELWTKPNISQMRESCSSLRPRYFVPKVSKHNLEPPLPDKCQQKSKIPPPVPPKPRNYILGQHQPVATTPSPRRPPPRKHSCMRIEKMPTDMMPRHRVQDECPVIEEKLPEDKTCYPRLQPRYIPQGEKSKKFDSICWKRKRVPKEHPKPKWVSWPPTQPEFHDDKPTCRQLRRKRLRIPSLGFSDTRPRFHDLSSDSSPQRRRKPRGILKKPSSHLDSSDASASKLSHYHNKRKPNADAETSDTDDCQRKLLPVCSSANALLPRYRAADMHCLKTYGQRGDDSIRLGKCDIPLRPPSAARYRAPSNILKGHENCYKDSTQWAGINKNFPPTYLNRARQNRKEIEVSKRQRLRMWSTKECPKPKYAPASKCQTTLKARCPSTQPHPGFYAAKRRLTAKDATANHKFCYRSSSGGDSDCTFMGRTVRRR